MALVKKKEDGKYLVRASRGTGKNRRYINKTIRGTLKEANAYARKIESQLDQGFTPQEITLTFDAYLAQWLQTIKSTVTNRTLEGYREYVERYAIDTLGRLKLVDIKAHHIQLIYAAMEAKGLSPNTVRNLHAALRACFTHAVIKEVLQKSPMKAVTVPKKRRTNMQVFTTEQALTFIDACQDAENGIIFELALETGMRPEEYLALRWRDIDFNYQTASVNRAVVFARKGGGFTFEECKTDHSRRNIPLSSELCSRLREHRRKQNEARLKLKVSYVSLDLVFANQIGTPYPLYNLTRRYFAPILESCGFPEHFTLYSLRHSCASLLLAAGAHSKIVQERLGHSSIVLTLDTYSHLMPGVQEDATAKLGSILRALK
jgi:integrase